MNNASPGLRPILRFIFAGFAVLFIFVVVVVTAIGSALRGDHESNAPAAAASSTVVTANSITTTKPLPALPSYQVVHDAKRIDGGSKEYVLIPSIDVTSAAFKDDARAIIRNLVKIKGPKTTVEVHDNASSLNTSYRQYGDGSLGRNRTDAEDKDDARHFIAMYVGGVEGMEAPDFAWFPAGSSDTPTIGKYVNLGDTL